MRHAAWCDCAVSYRRQRACGRMARRSVVVSLLAAYATGAINAVLLAVAGIYLHEGPGFMYSNHQLAAADCRWLPYAVAPASQAARCSGQCPGVPFCNAIWAVSCVDMAHIALQNGICDFPGR